MERRSARRTGSPVAASEAEPTCPVDATGHHRPREIEQTSLIVETARIRVPHRHRAGQGQGIHHALHAQVRVDQRPHPFGKAQSHAVADHRHIDAGWPIRFHVDAAAELDETSADPRGDFVQTNAARVESNRSGDVLERVRQAENDAPVRSPRSSCR